MASTLRFLRLCAPIAFAGIAQATIGYTSGSYSQNFDTLLNAPATGNTWTQNGTLGGWYALRAPGDATTGRAAAGWTDVLTYNANNGASNTGSIYSFGDAGSNDRALGSIASGTPGDFVIALVLQNNNSYALSQFNLAYIGEQWRNGGNTTQHQLEFDYAVLSSFAPVADLAGNNTAAYTVSSALTFTGPIATSTAAATNGNDSLTAQQNRNASINVNWQPGQYLVLRWWDDNNVGNDHGLGLDNVSFSATPEPSTIALVALGGLALLRRR